MSTSKTITTITKSNGKEVVVVTHNHPLDSADKGMFIFFLATVLFSIISKI